MLRTSLGVLVLAFASVAHAQMDPEAGDVWLPPPEDPQPGQVEPPPQGAQVVIDLQVQSNPPGAQVIANRQVIGVTPLDTQLPVQTGAPVRVTVQLAGYQPQTLDVDPSRPSHSLQVSLLPLDGSVVPAAGTEPVAGGTTVNLGGLAWDPRPRYELRGAFGFFTENNDTFFPITMTTLDLAARVRLLGDDAENDLTLDLAAEWSFYAIFVDGVDPEARPNNPNLTFLLGTRVGIARLYGGVGLALPLSAAIDDSTSIALGGHLLHGLMRGNIEPWVYAESHIALTLRGGVEVRIPGGSFGAEMVLVGLMAGIEAQYNSVPNEYGWQLRFYGGARPIDLLSFGGQVGIVYLANLEADADDVFISLEPFIRVHFDPAFIGLRFLLNLTDPFSFDDNGVWSLTLEAGADLD